MSKYFVPKLDPSQVFTASEYLVAHGQQISSSIKESIIEADRLLCYGERVKFALAASFTIEGKSYPGIAMVTTHNFYCCSSVNHCFTSVCIPLTMSISANEIKGFFSQKISICCEPVSVEVRASTMEIAQLKNALQFAISSASKYDPLTIPVNCGIVHRSAAQHRKAEKIKKSHAGVCRLSNADAATYGKCPKCCNTVLVEKEGEVLCIKCQYSFGRKK